MGRGGKGRKGETPEQRDARLAANAARRQADEARLARIAQDVEALVGRWRIIVGDAGSETRNAIGEWLAHAMVNGEAHESMLVDSGYDGSLHARATGLAHDLSRYDTVREFLEEALTGQTVPTFESGHGFSTESMDEEFERFVGELQTDWLREQSEHAAIGEEHDHLLEDAFYEAVFMEQLGYSHWYDVFGPLSPSEVVARWPVARDPKAPPAPVPERGREPDQLDHFLSHFPKDLRDHHLTFVTDRGTTTFASDNAGHLPDWWAERARLQRADMEAWLVCNRRIFTPMRDSATGLPIKRLSSCMVTGAHIIPQKSDETRSAFHTDAATEAALERMTDVIFEDFR